MEVQAVRGHPWAGVGVLLSPRGVEESQAGVPCAGGVEEVDQGVAPPGVVGGLLLAAAMAHWLRHCRTAVGHGSSLSGKGWRGP